MALDPLKLMPEDSSAAAGYMLNSISSEASNRGQSLTHEMSIEGRKKKVPWA